jgi:hypothetical protein
LGRNRLQKKRKKAVDKSCGRPYFHGEVIGHVTGAIDPGATSLKSGGGQGEWFFVVLHGQDAGEIWLLPM